MTAVKNSMNYLMKHLAMEGSCVKCEEIGGYSYSVSPAKLILMIAHNSTLFHIREDSGGTSHFGIKVVFYRDVSGWSIIIQHPNIGDV